MADKSPVKVNKNHGGKEFKSFFHFIGQVKAVRKKDDSTDSWDDQPIFEETESRSHKPMRKVQFNVETSLSNELKVELFGMEQQFAYPYSSKHRKAAKVAWDDRKDKEKYPDNTYHLIDPDWDKAEKINEQVKAGNWVEVKGHYEPQEFKNDEGEEFKSNRRVIDSVTVLEVDEEGKTTYKIGKNDVAYICDFNSPEFKEVNYFNMQIGIKSTYQDKSGDTKVNGVFLAYGKDRSEPRDVELIVYQTEPIEGKKTLADAFATLERLDFIEVTGIDNNRATFTYVPVEENLAEDDPFADVDESNKRVKMERVTSGTKKGLEIASYVTGSLIRGYLSEDEIAKTVVVEEDNPFGTTDISDDPFATNDEDPFA